MAEREYRRTNEKGKLTSSIPIQEMSTRQLRKYVREHADEANKRIESIKDIEDAPEALRDQLFMLRSFGSGRSGGVMKDTSSMSKIDMVEYAYALRDFNMLDTVSKYSRDADYRTNKKRYETFVKSQWDSVDKEARKYWSQFKTEKGNVSKKGYQEYKNFVNVLKSIDHTLATYGYETVAGQYYEQSGEVELTAAEIEKIALEVYQENAGKGLYTKDVTKILLDRLDEKRNPSKAAEPARTTRKSKKKAPAPSFPAPKKKAKKKSSQNIQVKTGGKMKNGTVRERQTTTKRRV